MTSIAGSLYSSGGDEGSNCASAKHRKHKNRNSKINSSSSTACIRISPEAHSSLSGISVILEVVGSFGVPAVVVDGGTVGCVLSAGGAEVTGPGSAPGLPVGAAPGPVVGVGGAVVVGGTDGNGSTFGCLTSNDRGIAACTLVDGRCPLDTKGY